jgi:hypothetical protein
MQYNHHEQVIATLGRLYPVAQFCLDQLQGQSGSDDKLITNMNSVKDTARELLGEVSSTRSSYTTAMCQRRSLTRSWELTQALSTKLENYLQVSATYCRSGSDTPFLQRTMEGKNSGAAKEILKELESTLVQLTKLAGKEKEPNKN